MHDEFDLLIEVTTIESNLILVTDVLHFKNSFFKTKF